MSELIISIDGKASNRIEMINHSASLSLITQVFLVFFYHLFIRFKARRNQYNLFQSPYLLERK